MTQAQQIEAQEFLARVEARLKADEPEYPISALDLLVGVAALIRSKEYIKIQGAYSDGCNGRCYTGLYLEYLKRGGYVQEEGQAPFFYYFDQEEAHKDLTEEQVRVLKEEIYSARFFAAFGLPQYVPPFLVDKNGKRKVFDALDTYMSNTISQYPLHAINDLSLMTHAEIHCGYVQACLNIVLTPAELLGE